MKRTVLLIGLVLFAATTWAEAASIRELLQVAAEATGTNFGACRAQVIVVGSNAVPELSQIVHATNEPWQVRLMAGICLERIQRGPELKALLEHDWKADPAYDKGWEEFRQGAGRNVARLVTQRCKEQQLLFYCLETIWKDTFEGLKGMKVHKMEWRIACRHALQGSPQFELLVPVLAERVQQDPGFKSYETLLAFLCIKDARKPEYLSFLLENWMKWPESETPKREVLDQVLSMASAQDIPFLEGFERSHGHAMGRLAEVLRSCIAGLKQNQQKK